MVTILAQSCALVACGTLLTVTVSSKGSPTQKSPGVSVHVSAGERQVRYVSGKTIYAEGVVDGRFVGKGWSSDGMTRLAALGTVADAFEIRLQEESLAETNGTLLSGGWRWVGATEAAETDRGARSIVVELSNATIPVTVKVHTSLDGTPVLRRWLSIRNDSKRHLGLTAVSPWAGHVWSDESPVDLGHSLRWQVPWEGWFGWKPLSEGTTRIVNDRDQLWDDPYFILRHSSSGEYVFGQLAWAANYRMEFGKGKGVSFKIGPTASKVLRAVAPGETITTPAVHLGYVKGTFDAAVQAMHDHIRTSVLPRCPPDRCNRVQYLIPEDWPMSVYRGRDFNEDNMKRCIDVAAAVGMEAFILDGPNWGSGYGNWLVPNRERFPNGLKPLADYAHAKGLLFGLYVESEGGRDGRSTGHWDGAAVIDKWKDSAVYREHPEWFSPGLNLDLSVPDAAAYFESEVSRIIDTHNLDIYRHDQNGIVFFPPGPGAGQTLREGRFVENNYWRHYEAFNKTFERLQVKHPNVLLQQAAAGNFRLDLGTIGGFHEHFTSDRATMPHVYRMLSGMSVFLPPEVLVNANGMVWPKDRPDLDTMLRGAYVLGNTPMIFNAILPKATEELTPEVRSRFLHYADLYKTFIRPLLHTSRVYHHAPVNEMGGVESGDWFAMEFGAPDRRKAWAVVIRLAKAASDTFVLKLRGVDPETDYTVTFDNTAKSVVLRGRALAQDGLRIALPADRASELLLLEAK